MPEQYSDRAAAILEGAVDLHVHTDPDPYADRRMDARELVESAIEHGLGGVVLKSHEYNTQPLAWLLNELYDDIDVFGGMSLDHGVGGLNPEAVRVAMRIGTRIVWFPTFDAAHWRSFRPQQFNSLQPPMRVLEEGLTLRADVHAILDELAEHDGVLATGHLATDETLALVWAARDRDIRTIVTHASFWIPTEAQLEMADLGAYIEHVGGVSLREEDGDEMFATIVEQVRAVGPQHVVISTDLGQAQNPPPPEGFGALIDRLLEAGFSDEEVATMVRDNPRTIVDD
jgi:hypothetical protein